jgi:hypothetical protein
MTNEATAVKEVPEIPETATLKVTASGNAL